MHACFVCVWLFALEEPVGACLVFVFFPGSHLRIQSNISGTWDELFEVACHNSVGFGKIPLVALNTSGFYDGIIQQIKRASEDQVCCVMCVYVYVWAALLRRGICGL